MSIKGHSLRQGRRGAGAARCGLLCLLCAFAAFAPFLFREGEAFHVWSDFSHQQIPFGISLRNSLEGLRIGGWNWSYELGMSNIQAFSFYALGSPFWCLSLLFPAESYQVLTGWIYLLKYTVAGVTAYCYIRRFTKRDSSAAAGALMYAFSGFQAANLMFYHFHDAVAFFPLILTGIEKVLEEPRNREPMILAVFLCALTNYYFLVMEAVFAVIYFLFRFFTGGERSLGSFLRKGGNCLLCGIWGGAMAAVLLVPSFLYVLQSPRSHPSLLLEDLLRDSRWFLHTAKGLLLPGDTLNSHAALYAAEYSSTAAWIPLAGAGLALAYLRKERGRKWLGGLLAVLLLLLFSPLLSSGFILFAEPTGRWLFMLTLMLALSSAIVMDRAEEYPVQGSLLVTLGALAALCGSLLLRPYDARTPTEIRDLPRFLTMGGVAAAGVLAAMALHRFRLLRTWAATGLVFLFAAGSTFLTLDQYYSYAGDGRDEAKLRMGMQLETLDDQYRYDLIDNQLMLTGGGSGMTVFSSTLSRGTREFDSLFGFYSMNHSLRKTTVWGLPELFGAKYTLAEADDGTAVQMVSDGDKVLYVLERDACPIGFAVDHYIFREDLMKIPKETRGAALLYAAVIDPSEEEKVSALCSRMTGEEIPFSDTLDGIVAENRENAVSEFSRDNRGFRCVSDYGWERMVYFSVPDEGGWSACVDGEKAEIIPSGGMMLLRVPAGRHEVVFTYVTPGYTAGWIMSLVSFWGFLGYAAWRRWRK